MPKKWLALLGLSALSFTVFLDFSIISTGIPFIQKALHASILQLQWVTNIFAMMTAMFMIFCGKLGDIFGRRKIYYIGFVFFAIAALGAGLANSIFVLIFFRAIQGFAGAIIFPLGAALLPQAFPADEQAKAVGVYSAITGCGLAIGPFVGGVLISLLSWRWIFFINLPIIFIGIIFCLFTLKESEKVATKIDWPGLIFFVLGLGSFIYGIIHGDEFGWQQILTWGSVSIGILSLIIFIIIETKVRFPLLYLHIFKNKHALVSIIVCIIAGINTSVFLFFDPLYLHNILAFSAFIIGCMLLLMPGVQVLVSLMLTRLLKRFSIMTLLVVATFSTTLAVLGHLFLSFNTSLFYILLLFVLMGYTWAMANTGTIAAMIETVAPDEIGGSIATAFTFWNIAGVTSLALASIIFNNRITSKMTYLLQTHSTVLTSLQQKTLSNALSNPQSAHNILNVFAEPVATKVFYDFKLSFLNGLHWVAIVFTIITFLFFLNALKLRK